MRHWLIGFAFLLGSSFLGCYDEEAHSPGTTATAMTPAEAQAAVVELQAARGVKPRAPQPVKTAEEMLDILQRDDIPRFEDASRFLEGKAGVDAITWNATLELLWSQGCATVAAEAKELGSRAVDDASRLSAKKDSGRSFTDEDAQRLERAKARVEFSQKAELALGVLARSHLATGSELARSALGQFPNDPRTYRAAAFYYLSTGMWGRYDDVMHTLGDADATDAGLIFLRALEALKRNSNGEDARGFLVHALSVNPKLVRAQAILVVTQDDIGASYAELVKLEALAPDHPIVKLTGPSIKSEYEVSKSFERAQAATKP